MVNSINNSNGFKPVNADQKTETRPQQNTEAAPGNTDKIELQMNSLREGIMSASEINKTRVEFLQEELASGRYQVDSLIIADKLLAEFGKNS